MTDNNELQLWLVLEKLTRIDNEIELFEESDKLLTEAFPGIRMDYFKIHLKRNNRHSNRHTPVQNPMIISVSNFFENPLNENPLSDNPFLESCYHKNSIITEFSADGSFRTYAIPLSYEKETQYILRIDIPGDPISPFLMNFFNIFLNYYRVIRSNDRDFLTGMYNRRAFNRVMTNLEMHHGVSHGGKSDYIIIIDIDFFKKINDNFGHMIGDEVLIVFSRVLKENVRSMDFAFRTGGEEFVIVARELSERGIHVIAERIRSIIENTIFPQVHTLTISGGFTRLEYPLDTFFALKRADAALYYSKDHGRNQMRYYETLVKEAKIPPVIHFKQIMDIW